MWLKTLRLCCAFGAEDGLASSFFFFPEKCCILAMQCENNL